MTLTLDVGNSNIVGGVFEDEKLVLQFRMATDKTSTSDELGIFLRSVLRENDIDPVKITKTGICSVVPPLNYSLSSAIVKYFGIEPLFIQAGIKTGLKIKLTNPKETGADLIAGAMGAVQLFPERDIIIVDMGTATTVCAVTKEKEFLGGSILPGLRISIRALAEGTSKLPNVEIANPEKACGNNTIGAIQSGIYYGNAGAIKELCQLFKKELFRDRNPFILGTGGLAKIYENYGIFDEIVPELVLSGVKTAIEMND